MRVENAIRTGKIRRIFVLKFNDKDNVLDEIKVLPKGTRQNCNDGILRGVA